MVICGLISADYYDNQILSNTILGVGPTNVPLFEIESHALHSFNIVIQKSLSFKN